jgi:hypothetical protein
VCYSRLPNPTSFANFIISVLWSGQFFIILLVTFPSQDTQGELIRGRFQIHSFNPDQLATQWLSKTKKSLKHDSNHNWVHLDLVNPSGYLFLWLIINQYFFYLNSGY